MEHEDCPRNYKTWSSKTIEATVTLELLLDLHGIGVSIQYIVSDDDSTMRATLQHIGTHKNGKLLLHISEPTFLCDPSHRIKVMVKDVFGLALMSNSKSECRKIDALRLKKYIGCWIGKSKLMPFDHFKTLSKAPVEHLFGNHQWCSSDWCFAASVDEAIDKFRCLPATVAPTPHPRPLFLKLQILLNYQTVAVFILNLNTLLTPKKTWTIMENSMTKKKNSLTSFVTSYPKQSKEWSPWYFP